MAKTGTKTKDINNRFNTNYISVVCEWFVVELSIGLFGAGQQQLRWAWQASEEMSERACVVTILPRGCSGECVERNHFYHMNCCTYG